MKSFFMLFGILFSFFTIVHAEDSKLKQLQESTWEWVRLVDPVNTVEIANPEQYTITFSADGKAPIKADCNRATGNYEADETGTIKVTVGPMTRAMCPPESKSDQFVKKLGYVAHYFFKDNHLFIDMMADGGTFEFRPAALTNDGIPIVKVEFEAGSDTATIHGEIKGDEIIDYLVNGTADETLSIELKPTLNANYFNITAPEEDSAMFIGSTLGNKFSGKLPKDGVYTIRVYLMRSAARRNESSTYTLQISKSS